MIKRSSCLCEGQFIHIESIYTVIGGVQVNIAGKVEELREKGRSKKLFCSCGCSCNVVLVAGDKGLRDQHFRVLPGQDESRCTVIDSDESEESINSKIVLKCWFDDKTQATDTDVYVPINRIDESTRKYEYTIVSGQAKTAISYSHMRENLDDEKINVLENNSKGIRIIYIVDCRNGGLKDQYPEWMMKVQNVQGFCPLLTCTERDYASAKMEVVFYDKDVNGRWKEISVVPKRSLSSYDIVEGQVYCEGKSVSDIVRQEKTDYRDRVERLRKEQEEKRRREEELIKQRREEQERRWREQEREYEERRRQEEELRKKHEAEATEAKRLEEELRIKREEAAKERARQEKLFHENLAAMDFDGPTVIKSPMGVRYYKCQICGKIGDKNLGPILGEPKLPNLAICYECRRDEAKFNSFMEAKRQKENQSKKPEKIRCPKCGNNMDLRFGRYGKYLKCQKCNYTDNF